MQRMRSFVPGLAGGAIGTALVLLVLVLGFDFGTTQHTTIVRSGGDSTVTVPLPAGSALSPSQIYDAVADGVVMVRATFPAEGGWDLWGGAQQESQSLGTGFVVSDDGDILTNAHVVLDDQGGTADSVSVVFNAPGGGGSDTFDAEVVGVDGDSDVAVLRVDPGKISVAALALGDSSKVVVGEPVVAIGNPLGYDFSITSGIVSAIGRSIRGPTNQLIPNVIQTDAAINPGNSGGPLIDGAGKVIGINVQIASQSGGNEGLGFAVPINTAVRVMKQLKATGTVTYAWLGIAAGRSVTPDVAETFDLPVQRGALVEAVDDGGPADEAGVRGGDDTVTMQGQQYVLGGDIIVQIDDTSVESFSDVLAYLLQKEPGDKVVLELVRDDKTRRVEVTLGERPRST
jgi:S1-C subfamily serine protease